MYIQSHVLLMYINKICVYFQSSSCNVETTYCIFPEYASTATTHLRMYYIEVA